MKNQLLNQIVYQYLDEPLFNQLRTIEQLGYVVQCAHKVGRDVIGFWICVQSEKQGCSYIRNSMDTMLLAERENVKAMDDEGFNTVRNAVLTLISEKDKNMKEEFERQYGEISTHRY